MNSVATRHWSAGNGDEWIYPASAQGSMPDTPGVLVSGPPGSGVTSVLQSLLQDHVDQHGEVDEVWLDCRERTRDTHRSGIRPWLAESLRCDSVRSLSSLSDELALRSGIPSAVVVDHIECLPAAEARWLMKSLSTVQGAGLNARETDCKFLIGGAVSGDPVITGIDEQILCDAIEPVAVSKEALRMVHEQACAGPVAKGARVDAGLLGWSETELGGEPSAVDCVYRQVADLDGPTVLDAAWADSCLSAALAGEFEPPPFLILDFVDLIPDILRVLEYTLSPEKLEGLSPRIRDFLFKVGYVRILDGAMHTRGPAVAAIVHQAVAAHFQPWKRLHELYLFLMRNIGLPPGAAALRSPSNMLVRRVLEHQIEGNLQFCYYATVERVAEGQVSLWTVRPDDTESLVSLESESVAGKLQPDDAVLYFQASDDDALLQSTLEVLR